MFKIILFIVILSAHTYITDTHINHAIVGEVAGLPLSWSAGEDSDRASGILSSYVRT